ncbi:MAG: zinc ribbon domain-containing protein [Anaerolineae bacterium]
MSLSLGLYRLQQVDLQIDQIQARLDAIRQTLENDAEILRARENFEAARQAQFQKEHALREAEAATREQRIKIEQVEARLYSGLVKNPKELQDLQNEAAALKRHLGTLEERELEAIIAAEQAEERLQQAGKWLEETSVRRSERLQQLVGEQNALEKKLEQLNAERLATRSALTAELLSVYQNLRQQRHGVAVAQVSDNSCAACGTTLTAALQQIARSPSQLAHCPSCGRILFAG